LVVEPSAIQCLKGEAASSRFPILVQKPQPSGGLSGALYRARRNSRADLDARAAALDFVLMGPRWVTQEYVRVADGPRDRASSRQGCWTTRYLYGDSGSVAAPRSGFFNLCPGLTSAGS